MTNHGFQHNTEKHLEALRQANEHLDARGIPEESVMRGLTDIHLACMECPPLGFLIGEMWPSSSAMMQ